MRRTVRGYPNAGLGLKDFPTKAPRSPRIPLEFQPKRDQPFRFPGKKTFPVPDRPKSPPGFGRARRGVVEMPRIPLGSPWGYAKGILPLIPMFDPASPTEITLPSGWVWCQGPVDPALPVCDQPTSWATKPWLVPGTCLLGVPLYGQGGTVLPAVPDATSFIWPFDNEYYAKRSYIDCNQTTTHEVVFGVAQRLSGTEVPYENPGTVWNPREVVPDRYGFGKPDTFVSPMVARPEPGKNPYEQIPEIQPSELGPVSERTERGYGLGLAPSLGLDLDTSLQLDPAPKPVPALLIDHIPAPPGKHIHEHKPRPFRVTKVMYAMFQMATEVQDFNDSLYYSIPKRIRGKRHRSPAARDWFLYTHINDVNVREAFKNYLNNEFKDRLYGGLGQLRRRAARKMGHNPYYSENTSGVAGYSRQAVGFKDDIPKFSDLVDSYLGNFVGS